MNFPIISFFEKAWPAVSKFSGNLVKNKLVFHEVCQEYGVDIFEDDFDFVYLQSLAIFLLDQEHHDWAIILELPDVRQAFQVGYPLNDFEETNRLLDHHLHATVKMGPLKNLNTLPANILSEFTNIFRELTAEHAKPSSMQTVRAVTDAKEELLSSDSEIKEGVNELKGDMNSVKHLLEQLTNSSNISLADKAVYQPIVDEQHQGQLDDIKKLIEQKFISTAQTLLLSIKERLLAKGSNPTKARLFNNIGYTFIMQDRQNEAISYYEQALQYADDDLPPITNLIGLYFAQKRYEDAKPLVHQLKESHPGLTVALNVYLENERNSDFEPDSLLPKELDTNAEALVALINVYIKRNARKALEYAKVLYDSVPRNDNYTDIYCNIALIALVGERVDFQTMQLQSETDKETLKEVRTLLEKLWNDYQQTDYKNFKLPLLERLALLVTVLRDHEGALRLAKEVLAINPASYHAKKLLAMNFMFLQRFEEASVAFDEIPTDGEKIWEFLPARMISHARAGRLKEVEEMSVVFLCRPDSTEEDHLRIYSVLAALLSEAEKYEKALKIIDQALKLVPNNIGFLADKGRILRGLDKRKEVIQCDTKLAELAAADLSMQPVKDIYIAANYLAETANFKLAADLMATFVDTKVNNDLTTQLARYYARSGRKGKALLIYENLRKQYGISDLYTREEVEVYYFYKDYARATEVLEEYHKLYPHDFRWWLNLGALYVKLGNQQALKQFCNVDTSKHDFTYQEIQGYMSILYVQGFRERCLDLAYHFRRKHPGLPANHLYVSYCLQDPLNKRDEVEELKSVRKNAAVYLQLGSAQYSYIVEDLLENELNKDSGEINLKDKKYKLLKGKKVGDKVSFKNQLGVEQQWEITSIIPKYSFAFQEAMRQNTTIYALESGYFGGEVNTVEDLERLIDAQIKPVDTVYQLIAQSELNYANYQLPLCVFARFNHKNTIEIYDYFIGKRTGIRYAVGNVGEYTAALETADTNKVFVLDMTALLTLHRVGFMAKLPDGCKLIISPITKELIENYVEEKSVNSQSDHFSAFEYKGQKVRMLVKAEDKLDELKRLQDFFAWVNINTETRPCKLLLDYDDEDAHKFKELFGADVFTSALLSKEVGAVYVSDDAANRRFIEEEYHIKGIWTQPLLKSFSNSEIITQGDYNEFVYALIKLGHQHTTVDSNDILLALERSNYQISQSFETLCQILSGKYSNDLSINIAFAVIAGIFQTNVPGRHKEDLIYFVLLTFISYRCLYPLLNRLSLHTPRSVRNMKDFVMLQRVISDLIYDIGFKSN